MIYTVTFNPSLDYIISVENFVLGKTNRTKSEQIFAGGKGINVSTVLKNLGVESTALGFVAGFTGTEIERKVKEDGIHSEFISLSEGSSRINVKMKDFDGTEINGMGPVVDSVAVEQLMSQLQELKSGDVLVLAGSIPATMSDTIYCDILSALENRGALFVVDATKELLLNTLKFHPFLVKPNHHELGELFDVELRTREDVIPYAKRLQENGARNVLVSMAGEGAVFVSEHQEVFVLPAPKGTVVNAVGAGDSMVAGFLAGWIEKKEYLYAFELAVAAGSASAFSEFFATREETEKLLKK